MKILNIVWLDYIKDKIEWKHQVQTEEVKEVFQNSPRFFFKEKGKVEGENLYNVLGRTDNGRYLSVFFIHKLNSDALIISARDMDNKERNRYGKK